MKLSELGMDDVLRYFASRLPNVRPVVKQVVRCPWHDDRHESFSLDLAKGVWKCHAGCGEGGLLDFEMRFAGCDRGTAHAEIARVVGLETASPVFREAPEARYEYRDASGKVAFQKLRYPGKRFVIRSQDADGRWQNRIQPGPKPLYNLPEVITANVVIVCEGEKDADSVNVLNLSQHDEKGFCRVAATTNFDGAGKWDSRYSPYFAGKLVLIFPDNDPVGKRHAQIVAESVTAYAHAVRVIELPGLPEKGDVSDYLQEHSGADLWAEIGRAKNWQPVKRDLLVSAPVFLERETAEIDWLVEGVIQRGANGFIVAEPKVGKSWAAVDLALAVATGQSWLGFKTERAPVALITREDHPNLTRWRMGKLLAGRELWAGRLQEWLWVNSKDQSPQFRLDEPTQLAEMLEALRQVKPELVILDVLNVLHSAEENDNTEMRKVMDCADLMHRDLRATVGILHHFAKGQAPRITQRLRGASGIAGWAEWVIGIKFASEKADEKRRMMQFDLKAGESPDPVMFTIDTDGAKSCLHVLEKSEIRKPKSTVEELLATRANGGQA